ncbi:PadR family transcriptional regulator [Alteromonas gracilis]
MYIAAMSTTESLLALLEPAPAHGYTLKQEYDRWFARRRPLAFGQVYATLGRLEKRGLVVQAEVEAGRGPERRLYEITPDGVTAVERWLYTPEAPDQHAASSVHSRLTIALLSGRDAAEVLAGQREAYLERMRELQRTRRQAAGPDLLAVTYELAHLDADLRWIAESGARLQQMAGELS